jgi:GAG-pre-integrase domain
LAINLSAHTLTNEPVQTYEASQQVDVEEAQTTVAGHNGLVQGQEKSTARQNENEKLRDTPIMIDFHDVDPRIGKEFQIKDGFPDLDPKSLKLLWHYRLGHLPFTTINRISQKGELPKNLSKCADPMCASCIYGQMTRRAWRTRAEPIHINRQ